MNYKASIKSIYISFWSILTGYFNYCRSHRTTSSLAVNVSAANDKLPQVWFSHWK